MQSWLVDLIDPATTEEVQRDAPHIAIEVSIEEARQVASRTAQFLKTRGWCLWRCQALGGDIIAVVRGNGVEGVPEGMVIYTELELEELFARDKPLDPATLRLIHEAKKHGAIIANDIEGGD